MDNYEPATYGDRIASVYDSFYSERLDPTLAVEFLAALANGGRALELGIGTGRVAIPLAARGVEVEGIDASEEMVGVLRAKPGGADIRVHIGDFTDVDVEGTFSLIYIPFNTFFALSSQAAQIQCLSNVRAHLAAGGSFAMDAFVPDLTRFRDNQCTSVVEVEVDHVMLDVSHHDPVNQTIRSSHVVLTDAAPVKLYPVMLRYAWPSELDAMAMAAGMRLSTRHGGYDRRRFDASCTHHVSIYQPAD